MPDSTPIPDQTPAPGSGQHGPPPPKELLAPNEGKQRLIEVDGQPWARIPLQTHAFASGEDFAALIADYVAAAVEPIRGDPELAVGFTRPWYLVSSEKIIAIAQGRSYFLWDIKPGWWARTLSRFVVKLPTGIGLGTPWTMQLAIQEAGLPRILLAAGASAVGKLLGRRGWFYRVAGNNVNAIDGPAESNVYPANVSAKLAPKDPDRASGQIRRAVTDRIPGEIGELLGGVCIIDANDLGRNVLGQQSDRDDEFFATLFADNPAGQGRQQTPVTICLQV
jgi:asparagine synthase (glutamine-hydrolysing)